MAAEFRLTYPTGQTLKIELFNLAGTTRWDGAAMSAPSAIASSAFLTGLIAMTETAFSDAVGTGDYTGTLPAGLAATAASYRYKIYNAPAAAGEQTIAEGVLHWNGSDGEANDLALAQASGDVTVNITPVISMVEPAGTLNSQAIEVRQYETKALTFTLLDSSRVAINDSGDSFKLVVYKLDKTTVVFQETGTAGGADGNSVPIIIDDAHTQTSGNYWYRLWNTTEDTVRAENAFTIKKGPEPTA